jgi:hypothetical protein
MWGKVHQFVVARGITIQSVVFAALIFATTSATRERGLGFGLGLGLGLRGLDFERDGWTRTSKACPDDEIDRVRRIIHAMSAKQVNELANRLNDRGRRTRRDSELEACRIA